MILLVGECDKLIYPVNEESSTIIYYVHTEELFTVIHDTHLAIGHGGRNRMMKELHRKYKNVTCWEVMIYLNLCETFQKKCKVPKKGLIVRPMIFQEMNSRCQVEPHRDYKFILVYQDNVTNVQLRPLKSKRAEEVAVVLLDIFTIFGASNILQSDNGREFSSRVIEQTCAMWPQLKIVHGKPRHSQSQASVERAN